MFNKVYEKTKQYIKNNYKFLIVWVAIILLFTIEVPYVVYTPGGEINLSERIEVENGYSSEGSFSMAYVSMIRGNIPFLFLSYLIPNWDIVATKDLKPANESMDEMIKADQISLLQAQNNAVYAAYHLAGKEVKTISKTNHIVYISDDAETDLELFDEILSINGTEIGSLEEMKTFVNTLHLGDLVTFKIRRNGEEMDKTARIYDTSDGLKVGVSITTTYEYETNPRVTLKAKNSESGPSGGLMSALAIYNSLVPEDITHGKKIIGTGTIDQNGNVGAIGGVKYKLLGAVHKKADIFLVPEENYQEAIAVKNEKKLDIRIISVKNLQEAIQAIS